MIINVNYPARIIEKKVKNIKFVLSTNEVWIELLGEHPEIIKVNLDLILKEYKDNELIIKDFLAKIISVASGLDKVSIPQDEIFKITKTESK